jgi:hypothetical protein
MLGWKPLVADVVRGVGAMNHVAVKAMQGDYPYASLVGSSAGLRQ